tara:strand:+ start:19 stop:582 length:564 start_codon:yes stop_codon:yes gene_type:complete
MKKVKIKIENNISYQKYQALSVLDEETRKQLDNMKIGQSFVVNSISHRDTILKYGRTTGKKFISRKIYEGNTKTSTTPYHFRIWRSEGEPKPLPIDKDRSYNVPSFGALTKSTIKAVESDLKDYSSIGSEAESHNIPEEVLTIAELRADNKKIVEDLEHIKKVLKEELGQDINYKPVSTTFYDKEEL